MDSLIRDSNKLSSLISAQSTVESVKKHVMCGVVLKTGKKSQRSYARTNINLEHADLVTSDDAAVNGRVECGAR